LASTYAQDEIQGLGYEEAARYVEAIRRVTAKDVVNAAARYLDRGRMAVAVLRPTGETVEA
jgi:predicted Zn-dependent peptidase